MTTCRSTDTHPDSSEGRWPLSRTSLLRSLSFCCPTLCKGSCARLPPPSSVSPAVGPCEVSLSCAQISCVVAERLRGPAPRGGLESLLGHGAVEAALYAFIPEEEKAGGRPNPSPCWCHWDWIYNHRTVRITLTSRHAKDKDFLRWFST